MITGLLALLAPIVLPALTGVLSGVGINLIGLLTSTGGKVAVQVVPLAVRLAFRVLNGDDATEDAKQLIGAADPRTAEKVRRELQP